MKRSQAPRKKEKQVVAEVSNCHKEKPSTPEEGKSKSLQRCKEMPPPAIKLLTSVNKARNCPHAGSYPCLSYFCGNSGCDFPMRDLRHRRCIEGVFCPHAPLRVSSKCERSRAGKSQPELPFKNPVDRLHFRFTKPQNCGTLEEDTQKNKNVEWSVKNWAF